MSMAAKRIIRQQTCTLSKEALSNFLHDYPIPREFKIMLPSKKQNIFDAPPGYVGLYVHAFTQSNFRIPIHPLILEFLQYYKVRISRLNPFGLAKLTTYIVMCKAYGYEPTVTVLRGFVNLYPGGDWITIAKRGLHDVPYLVTKPFSNIRNWKGQFFYVESTIIPPEYPALLDEAYKFDEKRFNDPLPYEVRSSPMHQRLARHPVDDRWEGSPSKPEIVCEGQRMAFRNFVVSGGAKEVSFIPKDPKDVSYGVGSPSVSVNNNDVDACNTPNFVIRSGIQAGCYSTVLNKDFTAKAL